MRLTRTWIALLRRGQWKTWLALASGVILALAGCGTVEPPRAPSGGWRTTTPSASPSPRHVAPEARRSEAARWIGTPYRYGGTDRRGVDCSGFVCQMYQRVAGVALPRTAASQFSVGYAVPKAALRPGDLVFFSEPGRGVFHVGVSLGADEFAHASTQRGVIISWLREPYYAARFCGARRVAR